MSYVFSTIHNKTSTRFDAHLDGKNVGYAVVKPYKNFMWLQSIKVLPSERGKGLSHKLIDQVTDHYSGKEIRLLVDPFGDKPMDKPSLQKLYSGHGFKPIDEKGTMARKEKTAVVSPYQQETQWTCSAACFKTVLEHYGISVSEQEAIELIGTRPNKGAECDQIADAARKMGLDAFEYSFDSIDQAKTLLDMDIPLICDIQSFNHPGKGHYVVLVSAAEDTVDLMDPNTPTNWRVISRQEMDERWWDRAMAPPHDLMPKWAIVILPPEGQNNDKTPK